MTELQQKAAKYGDLHAHLPLQTRLDIIAEAFNCKTGTIERRLCTGKWRGCTDVSIRFDNGVNLFIGVGRTPETKKKGVIDKWVNETLVHYNPAIVAETKKIAAAALLRREAIDNAIAAEKRLKPYKFLNVEINDGSIYESSGYIGWYYVTLEVDGKIVGHLETGLTYDIKKGEEPEIAKNYYAAGGLKEEEVDYVFGGIGFSATKHYTVVLSADAVNRALGTLEQRKAA